MGVEGSKVRTLFVDAAEEILRGVGYMGISARQVAAQAGLKTQLLYYYFRTMDDLILAVIRRVNERRVARFQEALAAPDPLQALWDIITDPSGATLAAEISSIANHREAVRAEVVQSATDFRAMQIEAVSGLLPPSDVYPAAGLVMIAAALSRTLVSESALGLTEGHAEAQMIVDRFLAEFAAARQAAAKAD
jgi:AcrR family transcriptional regulator